MTDLTPIPGFIGLPMSDGSSWAPARLAPYGGLEATVTHDVMGDCTVCGDGPGSCHDTLTA